MERIAIPEIIITTQDSLGIPEGFDYHIINESQDRSIERQKNR